MMMPLAIDVWNMSNADRHIQLVSKLEFMLRLNYVEYNPKFKMFREQMNLVYFAGLQGRKLVDLETLEHKEEEFLTKTINGLDCVLPDIMLFHENRYIMNKNETRVAGCPDLIVEVWSQGNTYEHRDIKRILYSSSEKVEFWQIYQDSNDVNCSIGAERLPDQNLREPLRTRSGLVVDLTSMALAEN